ncbi:hypothetical protein A2U01_0033605 [Trifolium medium]|uniref:Uncharacterized protein n=1 Tax=Trifolium medium TaxID=97028 RepID=A0A392PM21_9FABA|nr:hypothetical protein [Trifolium medium]
MCTVHTYIMVLEGNGSDERGWRRGFAMLDDDDDAAQTQKLARLVAAAASPILIRLLLAAYLSQ